MEKVIIYGKAGWPHTSQARSAYGKDVVYRDVREDPAAMAEMLKASGGVRQVPVIVKDGKVTVGYHGSW